MSFQMKSNSNKNPGENFYQYINHDWIKRAHIPDFESSYSVNEEIEQQIDANLFKILDECEAFALKSVDKKDSIKERFKDIIGRLILSSMRVKVQKNSIHLLKQKIDNLHCIRSIDDIGEVLGYLCKHKVSTLLNTFIQLERTKKNSSIYTLILNEGSLGLPDDSYYKATAPGKLRTLYAYINLVKKVCKLLDIDDLSSVIPLESYFSAHIKNNEVLKNDEILFEGKELVKKFPIFPWNSFFSSLDLPNYLEYSFRVSSIHWIQTLEKSFSTITFEQWKNLFKLHVVLHALPLLPPPYDDIHFDFFENRLKGQKKKISQKYLTLNLVKNYLSTQLSILYKDKYLKDSLKKNATDFIKSVHTSAIKQIQSNTWMETKTKEKAKEKVKKMVLSIGWPEKYPLLFMPILETDNLLSNIYALSSSIHKEEINLLNKKSKPGVFWSEASYLVNAFYYNEINEFIIPAGSLMKPFYDKDSSIGWNYGGLGCVIGHEMVHAFDEDGRNYDEHGLYNPWWSKKDNRYFQNISKSLIEQYNKSKIYDVNINGKKTLNENIADLGGMSIALEALKNEISSYDENKKKVEYQQFFISYAVSWRTKEEKQKVLQNIFMDVHSPPEFRVNNIVVHFDEWYYAFDIEVGDKLYIPPEERIRIF